MVLAFCLGMPLTVCAQKKEISKAKDDVKAGKSLVEAEASMRKLLADSTNKANEKIWLVLFDAVRKQYETLPCSLPDVWRIGRTRFGGMESEWGTTC